LPQLPQLLLSVCRLTQLPPQYVWVAPQQWLLVQCGAAPVHAVVHEPQCASVDVRSWHPSPQHVLFVPHVMPQLVQ
jgi:hypothetical protein